MIAWVNQTKCENKTWNFLSLVGENEPMSKWLPLFWLSPSTADNLKQVFKVLGQKVFHLVTFNNLFKILTDNSSYLIVNKFLTHWVIP